MPLSCCGGQYPPFLQPVPVCCPHWAKLLQAPVTPTDGPLQLPASWQEQSRIVQGRGSATIQKKDVRGSLPSQFPAEESQRLVGTRSQALHKGLQKSPKCISLRVDLMCSATTTLTLMLLAGSAGAYRVFLLCFMVQQDELYWSLIPGQADLWTELGLPSLDSAPHPLCRHLQSHVAFIFCVLPKSQCKMNDTVREEAFICSPGDTVGCADLCCFYSLLFPSCLA